MRAKRKKARLAMRAAKSARHVSWRRADHGIRKKRGKKYAQLFPQIYPRQSAGYPPLAQQFFPTYTQLFPLLPPDCI
ncbi:hypothetical protein V8J88_22065 [Massilia sp. W12]|uniref:hypothetical protein n=1 Tax=Massilia sp. W12 TaxID=3126507 RepID=UPI0030CEE367